ncbi:DUF1492 domain-containing protein [Oscillospiraceae bacterium WX1]
MNWRKEAENELKDYGRYHESLKHYSDMLKDIDNDITSIGAVKLDVAPNGGSSTHSREDWFINKLEKKNEIDTKITLVKKRMELIERALQTMSRDEKRILQLFFVERPKNYIDRLCDELGYEQSNLYYHKDIALRKFTLAIFGVIDT